MWWWRRWSGSWGWRADAEGMAPFPDGPGTTATRQGLRQFVGISGANSGARGLSMNRVVIPPGGRPAAQRYVGSESAIYLL